MSNRIPAALFIAKAEEIAGESPVYKSGEDGTHGECDCIGLIIGAIRRAGGQWRGLHGSNYAARHEVESLRPITATSELEAGEVVFKAYEPGQGKYNLPEKYEGRGQFANGDLRDYYHIGIVESVYPLRIRHVTTPVTPAARMDTSIGKWGYHGRLKKVDYSAGGNSQIGGEGAKKMEKATVVLSSSAKGSTVNLRSQPNKEDNKNILVRVPVGTVVDIVEDNGAWCKINAQGFEGWMMSNYLEYQGGGEEISGDILTAEEREKIDGYLADVENRIESIRTILGRG